MIRLTTALLLLFSGVAAGQPASSGLPDPVPTFGKPLVTFIELGSVNCVPCKLMKPVMEATEQKYGEQVKVVFYDVWTPQERHYAAMYKIRVIPTQVFLDKDGKEFFRHEGFFPVEAVDQLLQKQGLKPKKGS